MKKALITGITGQDGAYLADFLLKKGYEVQGIKRRSSLLNTERVDHLYQDPLIDSQKFYLHYGDMTDSTNINNLIRTIDPDEIYNLAATSHVAVSFEKPNGTDRKLMDVSKLNKLGWKPKIKLKHGIQKTIKEFLKIS